MIRIGGAKSNKTKVHVQYCYSGVPSGSFNGQNDMLQFTSGGKSTSANVGIPRKRITCILVLLNPTKELTHGEAIDPTGSEE